MPPIRVILSFILLSTFVGCQEEVPEVKNDSGPEVPDFVVYATDTLIDKAQSGEIFYQGKLFAGFIVSKYEDGSVSMSKGYYNGKLHGKTTAYYPNGQVMYSRPYVSGEKHGHHKGFYSNGQKKFHYYFSHGFSEGNHKSWYDDGAINSDMNYTNGKELGKQQVWRQDGKLRANYIVRENGRRYGLQGIKRCTKLDGVAQTVDPYKGDEE